MLFEALAGGVEGGSRAVSDISVREQDFQASQLAQKLKQEAELEIQKRVADYQFGQQKELEGIRQQGRMQQTEREATLKEGASEKEFERQKKAGLFTKDVSAFGKLVDPETGKTIATGTQRSGQSSKTEYTMSQKIDDLLNKYKAAIEAAKEMAGYIDPKDKDEINKAYAKDEQLVRSGKDPINLNQFLMGSRQPDNNDPLGIRIPQDQSGVRMKVSE